MGPKRSVQRQRFEGPPVGVCLSEHWSRAVARASATDIPSRTPARAARREQTTTSGTRAGRDKATGLCLSSGRSCSRRCSGHAGRYTHMTRRIVDLHNQRLPIPTATTAQRVETHAAQGRMVYQWRQKKP